MISVKTKVITFAATQTEFKQNLRCNKMKPAHFTITILVKHDCILLIFSFILAPKY